MAKLLNQKFATTKIGYKIFCFVSSLFLDNRPILTDFCVQMNPYEQYVHLPDLFQMLEAPQGTAITKTPTTAALTCALSALELTAHVIQENAVNNKASSFSSQREKSLLRCMENQAECLSSLLSEPLIGESSMLHFTTTPSPTFLEVLPGISNSTVERRFRQMIDFHLELMPFKLASDLSSEPFLDYAAYVNRDGLANLFHRDDYGCEHKIFVTVHQIIECWVQIVESCIEAGERCIRTHQLAEASVYQEKANECAAMITNIAEQLQLMSNADYHPLRVRLRDASGAQSRKTRQLKTRAHKSFELFLANLQSKTLTLLLVLVSPEDYLEEYRMLLTYKEWSRCIQAFFFHHYLLLLSVLGLQNYGSIGYKVSDLVKPCAKPIFSEINEALYEFTSISNLMYADVSGHITHVKAIEHGTCSPTLDPCVSVLDSGRMTEVVDVYFESIGSSDGKGWVELFHKTGGSFVDHGSAKPFVGRHKLGVFIKTFFGLFSNIQPTWELLSTSQSGVVVGWKMEATFNERLPVEIEGEEHFEFTEDYQFSTVTSNWGSKGLAEFILSKEHS